jgi:hypothetical protein
MRRLGFDSDWFRLSFVVDEVEPGQDIPPSLFRFSPTNHYLTIAPYSSIWNAIILIRQHIITHSLFKFGASYLTRHLVTHKTFYSSYNITTLGRDSSVSIVTGYGLVGRGLIPSRGEVFFLSTVFRPALGLTQPPIQWVPGREANHSPSSSAEFKNGGAIPPRSHTSSCDKR